MRILTLLIASIFILQSCSYTGEMKEAKTDGLYTISFPDYMKPSKKNLHEDAILQYDNPYRNTYAIIMRDEKKVSFAEYQKDALDLLKNFELLRNPLVTDSAYFENPTAIKVQLYGLMNEENIYYWHNTIESETYYYQVIVWTRSMDRKQRYGADIENIVASFKAFK
jgi:hypothetical protein